MPQLAFSWGFGPTAPVDPLGRMELHGLAVGRVVERCPDVADHREIVRDGPHATPAWEGQLTREARASRVAQWAAAA